MTCLVFETCDLLLWDFSFGKCDFVLLFFKIFKIIPLVSCCEPHQSIWNTDIQMTLSYISV